MRYIFTGWDRNYHILDTTNPKNNKSNRHEVIKIDDDGNMSFLDLTNLNDLKEYLDELIKIEDYKLIRSILVETDRDESVSYVIDKICSIHNISLITSITRLKEYYGYRDQYTKILNKVNINNFSSLNSQEKSIYVLFASLNKINDFIKKEYNIDLEEILSSKYPTNKNIYKTLIEVYYFSYGNIESDFFRFLINNTTIDNRRDEFNTALKNSATNFKQKEPLKTRVYDCLWCLRWEYDKDFLEAIIQIIINDLKSETNTKRIQSKMKRLNKLCFKYRFNNSDTNDKIIFKEYIINKMQKEGTTNATETYKKYYTNFIIGGC